MYHFQHAELYELYMFKYSLNCQGKYTVLAMLPDYGRCTKLKQNSYNEFQESNSAASVDSTCSHSNQRYNDVTSVKPNVNLGLQRA